MPTEATSLDLDLARQVLAAQPFARLVGTELTEFGDGAATLVIEIQPEHGQQFGFVHGGVLAYAADNALTFAAGTVLGPNVLTGGFTITYLRPAKGERLRVHATVLGATRRQAVTHCDVYAETEGEEPIHCAVAQGTTRRVEKDLTPTAETDEDTEFEDDEDEYETDQLTVVTADMAELPPTVSR
ncbi:PaaI family thioesterase [Nocardia sp. NEAU-G4]|uniref:Medium/long-chain acyl-CoA thioesterase YigI n=1 Tax=Nocardia coubleae TaxID=356147 RepID=A0A846W426_9NOCA|nr:MULTISPECIES: PaaI family thioesterase [Nocardia]MCA2209788.1 PaaI family thioesterase [Nocardia rosealba]NKX87328.1 PaaI family thioesterase [Nocardia coubleae]